MPPGGSLHVTTHLDKWINITLVLVSLSMLVSFALVVSDFYRAYRAQATTLTQLNVFEQALRAMEAVSAERGPTNGMLGGQDGDPQKLQRSRTLSDERLAQLARAVDHCQPCVASPYPIADINDAVQQARARVDHLLSQSAQLRAPQERAMAVTAMIEATQRLFPLIDWLSRDIVRRTPQISATLYNTYWAAQLREIAGQWGTQLTPALAEQRPLSVEETRQLQLTEGSIEQLQMQLWLGMGNLPGHFNEAASHQLKSDYANMQRVYSQQAMAFHRSMTDALDRRVAPSPAVFAEHYVPPMGSIIALRDTALRLTNADLQRATQKSMAQLLLVTGLGVALLILLGVVFVWLRRRVINPLLLGTHRIMTLLDAQGTTSGDATRHFSVHEAVQELERQLRQGHAVRHERDELIAQLKSSAETDHLTGLPNRRAFERAVQAPSAASGLRRAIILFDVDHFKRINDTYGHAAGDRLLQLIAARCQAQMRGEEHVARIGGEEFAVQLWLSNTEAALHFAERLRRAISEAPYDLGMAHPVEVTASFGVALASQSEDDDAETLRALADAALYRAKHKGRNRSELAV